MELEDYKEIISLYQQKSFDLFNENIVLRSQISSLSKRIDILTNNNKILVNEIEKIKKTNEKESNKTQTTRKKVTNEEIVDY